VSWVGFDKSYSFGYCKEDMKDNEMVEPKCNILYTIGHSNHTIEDFIALLKRYGVTCIADVRSAPYSRYCPQFNKGALAASLQAAGITYMFLGKELGARPDDPSCYEGGCVNFQRLAKREEFERLKWTRLSCHDFDDNQIRLQLFAMAYNIGNFLRRLALPKQIKDWSLRTMREKLVKIGAKVVNRLRKEKS
jgi:hypothetical protein